MATDSGSEREILGKALARTPNCPPIEKLEACLDAASAPGDLARHLESCAYCQTELEMMRSFFTGPRNADEEEAVRQITERLRLPQLPVREVARPWWKRVFEVRWLGQAAVVAAGLLIAAAVGLEWRHSGAPNLAAPSQPESDVLRSGTLKVVTPLGDVRAVPNQIQWEQVPGASRYRIGLFEVDHTELWTASTAERQIDLPTAIKAKIVPAKTILVQVAGFDNSGRKVAESEFVRFRFLQTIYSH